MFPPTHRSAFGGVNRLCIAQACGGCTRSLHSRSLLHLPCPAKVTSLGNRQRPQQGGIHEGRIHGTPTCHYSPPPRPPCQGHLPPPRPLPLPLPHPLTP